MTRDENKILNQHRRVVETVLADSPEDVQRRVLEQITYLAENLNLYQAELKAQNEALRTSQQELELARDSYLALFHQAPVGYLILDEAGIILNANRTFSAMVAAPPESVRFHAFHAYLDDDSRRRFLSQYRHHFKSPRNQAMDVVMLRTGGHPFHGRLEMRRERIPGPTHVGQSAGERLLVTVMDITEVRRAEAERLDSETRFRILVDQASDAVYLADTDMRLVMVNQEACRMLGYSRGELERMRIDEIQQAYTPEQLKALFARLEPGRPRHVEGRHLRKDGTEVPVEVSLVSYESRGSVFFLGIARDISERKKTEAERERLIDELHRSLAEIKTLRGLLPICSHCKKIRDDRGLWNRIEAYISRNTYAEFSHGICPECMKKHYGDLGLGKDD